MSAHALGSRERFPEELWLEIVNQLPHKSRLRISVVDHTLRRISRPFLFSHFCLIPYAPSATSIDGDIEPVCHDPDMQLSQIEHLEFKTSPEIAPLIHTLDIRPWNLYDSRREKRVDSPFLILDMLFSRLSLFVRLHTVRAYNIIFTHIGLVNLCGLPALTHLEVNGCTVTDYVDEPSLDLHRISNATLGHSGRSSRSGLDPWIRLIDVNHVVELVLEIPSQLWGSMPALIPEFPHVTRLHLHKPWCQVSLPISVIVPILLKFPSVTDLSLARCHTEYQTPYPPLLPNIQHFFGSFAFLSLIICQPTLTSIGISNLRGGRELDFVRNSQSNVRSVSLFSPLDDLEEFSLWLGMFPCLERFHIRSYDDVGCQLFTEIAPFLYDLIHSPSLSISLDSLRIFWGKGNCEDVSSSEEEDDTSEEDEDEDEQPGDHINGDETKISLREKSRLTKAEAVAGLRSLMAKFRALSCLEIQGHAFLFHAFRRSDGTIKEEIIVTARDFNRFSNGNDSDDEE
ncbi:hypothetical protein R3P38DRAFT_3147559 [Favolaschia claudopus]|uniref:F-box domain-containing protein n=1 Tax=Favolaschia claudopus TaxID=2862362 RepID=A0AAV9Z278_9AGAR